MSIIKRIKTSYKWLKEAVEYQRSSEREVIIPQASDINDEKMIVIKNDRLVKQYNMLCAMSVFAKFMDNTGQPLIILTVVTDNIYDELSENAKRFIILHEKGHFIHHFDKIVANTNYTRNLNDEFQADEYTIKELGVEKVLEALNELKNMTLFPDTISELRKRIKHIKILKNKE